MQLGGGVEFSDHRGHTPGTTFGTGLESVRATGSLLLKRFQEEEDSTFTFCSIARTHGAANRRNSFRATGDCGIVSRGRLEPYRGRHRLCRRSGRHFHLLVARTDSQFAKFLENLSARGPTRITTRRDQLRSSQSTARVGDRRQRPYDPNSSNGLDILRHGATSHVVQITTQQRWNPTCSAVGTVRRRIGSHPQGIVTGVVCGSTRCLPFQAAIQRYCNSYGLGVPDHDGNSSTS